LLLQSERGIGSKVEPAKKGIVIGGQKDSVNIKKSKNESFIEKISSRPEMDKMIYFSSFV
jgi:hypothetical protein